MDFYQQAEQALNYASRDRKMRRIRWAAGGAAMALVLSCLTWSNASLRGQRDRYASELAELQRNHTEQMETLSTDLFETGQELAESQQRTAALELQNQELAKRAAEAKDLEQNLQDAWAELDDAALKIKELTASRQHFGTVTEDVQRLARTDW